MKFKIEFTLAELRAQEGNFDWNEVFKYAVNPESLDGVASRETFVQDEVKKVIASVNGENDESSWLMLGQLKDGRFFKLQASCDYTGWGCQEGGDAHVAITLKAVEKSLEKDERERLCSHE